MKTKAMLIEACGSAARQWVLSAEPNKEPKPISHYEYVNGRWAWIRIEYNGEELPPQRRADDKVEVKRSVS